MILEFNVVTNYNRYYEVKKCPDGFILIFDLYQNDPIKIISLRINFLSDNDEDFNIVITNAFFDLFNRCVNRYKMTKCFEIRRALYDHYGQINSIEIFQEDFDDKETVFSIMI